MKKQKRKRAITVVVDMQVSFVGIQRGKAEDCVKQCRNVVKDAIKRGDFILYVQYKGHGVTVSEITNVTKRYADKQRVWKSCCDGSRMIKKNLDALGIIPSQFTVCGLYTDQCVRETIEGLVRKFEKKVILVKDACYTYSSYAYQHDIYQHPKVEQV